MSVWLKLREWWADRHDVHVSTGWLESLADQEAREELETDRLRIEPKTLTGPTSDYTRTV